MSFRSTSESKTSTTRRWCIDTEDQWASKFKKLGVEKSSIQSKQPMAYYTAEFLVAAEENRSGRKRKRKTISIGSTPSSTTEIPKTSENSNNPSKERKKSGKTMTLKEGRVVETPTNAESSLEKNKDTKKQNTKDTKREVIKIEDSGSEESENETKTFNPEKIQKSLRFQFVITLIAGSALIFFNPAVTFEMASSITNIYL